jgi:hypothetical protein
LMNSSGFICDLQKYKSPKRRVALTDESDWQPNERILPNANGLLRILKNALRS